MTEDIRFPTANTNLASCIGALRIPIKQTQPITIIEEAKGGKRTCFYWFEMDGETFLGKNFRPAELQAFWNSREKYELASPDHPLIPMRKALEAMQWINSVFFGKTAVRKIRFSGKKIRTQNVILAACLKASEYNLLSFDNVDMVFEKPSAEFTENFQDYNQEKNEAHPAALMRRVLEVRSELLELIRHPKLVPLIHFTNGNPLAGGREAYIPRGASEETIEKTMEILHN